MVAVPENLSSPFPNTINLPGNTLILLSIFVSKIATREGNCAMPKTKLPNTKLSTDDPIEGNVKCSHNGFYCIIHCSSMNSRETLISHLQRYHRKYYNDKYFKVEEFITRISSDEELVRVTPVSEKKPDGNVKDVVLFGARNWIKRGYQLTRETVKSILGKYVNTLIALISGKNWFRRFPMSRRKLL